MSKDHDNKAPQEKSRGAERTAGTSNAAVLTPEVTGQERLETIRPVDLSLHGDGISHWQDEAEGGDTPGKKGDNVDKS